MNKPNEELYFDVYTGILKRYKYFIAVCVVLSLCIYLLWSGLINKDMSAEFNLFAGRIQNAYSCGIEPSLNNETLTEWFSGRDFIDGQNKSAKSCEINDIEIKKVDEFNYGIKIRIRALNKGALQEDARRILSAVLERTLENYNKKKDVNDAIIGDYSNKIVLADKLISDFSRSGKIEHQGIRWEIERDKVFFNEKINRLELLPLPSEPSVSEITVAMESPVKGGILVVVGSFALFFLISAFIDNIKNKART